MYFKICTEIPFIYKQNYDVLLFKFFVMGYNHIRPKEIMLKEWG